MIFRIERGEGFTQAEATSLLSYLESRDAFALPSGTRVMVGTTEMATRMSGGWFVTEAALRKKEST